VLRGYDAHTNLGLGC